MNTFDEIIQTKAYKDLSSDELEVIRELVSSEAEYNEMKSFYAGIDQLALSVREEVSPSVKSSLNSVFQAKHPGINQNWNAPADVAEKKVIPLYNRTLFRAAALLVLSAGVASIWFTVSENRMESKLTASNAPLMQEESKEQAPAPKKEFPLEQKEKQKEFTAESGIPADENVNQDMTVYSNATLSSQSPSPFTYSWSTTEKSVAATNGATASGSFSFKSPGTTTFYSTTNGNTANYSGDEDKLKKKGDAKADSKEELGTNLLKAGLSADLNPGGYNSKTTKDYKPSISNNDLLSLIEPSF